jgi:hypothetical protein
LQKIGNPLSTLQKLQLDAVLTANRKRFIATAILMAVFILASRFLLAPLTTGDIVQLELAKTPDRAMVVLDSIEAMHGDSLNLLLNSVYLDFLFILIYTAFFFVGSRYLSSITGNIILRRAGIAFSWLAVLAGICDIVENIGLMRIINGHIRSWVVHLTYDMAVLKFSMLMLVAFYMMICFIAYLLRRVPDE